MQKVAFANLVKIIDLLSRGVETGIRFHVKITPIGGLLSYIRYTRFLLRSITDKLRFKSK